MRDIIILLAIYLLAAVCAIVGILGLVKHGTQSKKRSKRELSVPSGEEASKA
ncbi:MAG: hypothetical protein ACQ5SW_04880 [Sphaerochaetaceae bacterium]